MNRIICGDALELLRQTPTESVNLIITSPPYYRLRKYPGAEKAWGGDANCNHQFPPGDDFCLHCGAWYGQLGLEPDWRIYLDHLAGIMGECYRVLQPSGNLVINLGDRFAGGNARKSTSKNAIADGSRRATGEACQTADQGTEPAKMKLGLPWRVRFTLNANGWISRDDIVWEKPNAMPTSAPSRLNTVYEMVFRFIKNALPGPYYQLRTSAPEDVETEFRRRCLVWGSVGVLPADLIDPMWRRHLVQLDAYFDLDAIRRPYKESTLRRALQPTLARQQGGPKAKGYAEAVAHGQGRAIPNLLRSLGSREQGKFGRAGVSRTVDGLHDNRWEQYFHPRGANPGDVWHINTKGFSGAHFAVMPEQLVERCIQAYCPPDGLVLDPFCGAGTIPAMAAKMGRRWLGFDINPDYCALSMERVASHQSLERLGVMCTTSVSKCL